MKLKSKENPSGLIEILCARIVNRRQRVENEKEEKEGGGERKQEREGKK